MGKYKKYFSKRVAYRKRQADIAKGLKLRGITKKPSVYSYKQTYILSPFETTYAGNTVGAITFSLSNISQSATFTALYDEYCITKVVIRFVPTASINNNADPTTYIAQPFYTIIDYDDNTVPAGLTEMLDYDTLKYTVSTKTHTRTLIPRLSMLAYKTSGSTIGYAAKSRQWIDCSNADVPHYGVKYFIGPNGGTTAANDGWLRFQPIVTMYIKFRGVR